MSEGDEQRQADNERSILDWLASKFPGCAREGPFDVDDGAWRSFVVRPSKGRFRLRVWQENLTEDWGSPTAIVNALESCGAAARMRLAGRGYVECRWDKSGWQCRDVEPDETS
jgi:hypothetical protein